MRDTPRILIIDDEEQVRGYAAVPLRRMGYDVLERGSEAEALELARLYRNQGDGIHVVLLDIELTVRGNSLPLIEQIRDVHPGALFVVMSALVTDDLSDDLRAQFKRYDVYDFLPKPFPLTRLRDSVRRAVRQVETQQERDRFQRDLVARNQNFIDLERDLKRRIGRLKIELHRARLSMALADRVADRVVDAAHRLMRARELPLLLRTAIDVFQSIVPSEATIVFSRKTIHDAGQVPFAPQDDLSSLIHKIHIRGGEMDEREMEGACLRFANEVASTGRILRRPRSSEADRADGLPPFVRSVIGVPLVCEEHGVIGVVLQFNRLTERGTPRLDGFSRSDALVLTHVASFLAQGILSYHESGVDPLTGLPNRRALDKRFRREMERLRRGGRPEDQRLWIAVADIDHFREYNTECGHLVGDGVLCGVGRALERSLRDFVSRWGGEEFVILLRGPLDDTGRTTDEDVEGDAAEGEAEPGRPVAGIMDVLDRARIAVSQLPCPYRPVTVSIGVSRVCPDDTFEEVFERANPALYRAKRSGRNRVEAEQAPC